MFSGLKWLGLSTILGLPILATVIGKYTSKEEENVHVKNGCYGENKSRFLMIVSTLDGKLSALDIKQNGRLQWSIDTEAPLISSSIGNLEINRDGLSTRLIPSLDGGLYQFDGESIQAVPITAESLLKSSFKLNDDSVIVGAKEMRTYGVNIDNGQSNYVCGPQGCEVYHEETVQSDDLIVVKKSLQTVRAVNIRSGQEKWNFSVGQHEITFLEGATAAIEADTTDYDDDDVTVSTCQSNSDDDNSVEDVDIKVIVPHGLVMAVSRSDPSHIVWKQKFEHPVAEAWLLKGSVLKPVSLFDDNVVPALEHDLFKKKAQPMLYLGLHQNQMYVQPSVQMADHVLSASDVLSKASGLVSVPRVKWKPYLSSAPSRTPYITTTRKPALIGDDKVDPTKCALQIWQEMDYPYDNGYYLFADKSPIPVKQLLSNEEQLTTGTAVIRALWNWWKEVAYSTLAIAILTHLLVWKYVKRSIKNVELLSKATESDTLKVDTSDSTASTSTNQTVSFNSRYYTDFEEIHCLGKGGFGMVFEAKNKVDDCHYAIKRIQLTNSDEAKERVMREVKALAKLDNSGIVRYHGAWFESPPPGWLEEKDKDHLDSEGLMPTPCNTGVKLSSLVPDQSTNWEQEHNNSHSKIDQSQSFIPMFINNIENEESGSFSHVGTPSRPTFHLEESSAGIHFDNSIIVQNETESLSGSNSLNDVEVPFQRYKDEQLEDHDDISIVFEDSGKGSHSESAIDNDHIAKSNSDDALKNLQGQLNLTPAHYNSPGQTLEPTKRSQKQKSQKQSQPSKLKLYLYIQMQLCKRESLKDWLNANILTRDRNHMLDIFSQIAEAMDYVHDSGLMHRDLKPSNIFFSVDGLIKIGDFGLVTAMAENHSDHEMVQNGSMTKIHTDRVGTQLYMSPEQIAGRPYCHKVDLYSMGLIFLELFHNFSTQMERVQTIQRAKKGIFPQSFVKKNQQESDFVKWLLTHNPDKRPSVKEILLSDLLQSLESQHQFSNTTQHKRHRSRTVSSSSS